MQLEKDQTPTPKFAPTDLPPPLRLFQVSSGFFLVFLVACAGPARTPPSPNAPSPTGVVAQISAAEIQHTLNQFADQVETTLWDTTSALRDKAQTREQRRAALRWYDQIVSQVRDTTGQDNPLAAFLDTWSLMIRMRRYLERGDGRDLFGENQTLAVQAAKRLEKRIESLAEPLLGKENVADVRKRLATYADEHPMTEGFTTAVAGTRFSLEQTGRDTLGFIASLPLAPIRAVTRIGEGAGSVRDISVTAERFTNVVEALPEDTRVQLELFLLQIEDSDMVTSVVRNFQEVSESTTRLSRAAETLPERVGRETRRVLADVEQRQPALSRLLQDAGTTLDEAGETARAFEQTVQSATEAARAWREMADSVGEAVRDINALAYPKKEEDAEREPGGKPFDIDDYTRAAVALTSGTQQLRMLLHDVHALSDADLFAPQLNRINQQAEAVVDRSTEGARSLINLSSLRAAQLLALGFALAVLYRFIATRTRRKESR